MPDAQVRADLDGLTRSEAALASHLKLGFDPSAPSRLPGWTVGHVVTHLARNADAMRRVFAAAARGEVADMYPDGASGRAAAIDAGASRSAPALLEDLTTAATALGVVLAGVPDDAWVSGCGRTLTGERTLPELLVGRWREVEIHRVDLGIGDTWERWPADFVARVLPDRVEDVNARREPGERFRVETGDASFGDGDIVVRADAAQALAYLVGRTALPGLPDLDY